MLAGVMMSVAAFVRLTDLVQPPDYPVRANGDWKRFTSVNGFPPPEDYRMLVREYGSGTFGGVISLIEPFDPSKSFMDLIEPRCRALRNGSGRSVWPEPGGFLPWGVVAGGGLVGWRTDGRPNDWPTVYWSDRGHGPVELPMGAVGFVVGVLERTLDPALLAGLTVGAATFTSA
ncbi:MAG: SMI1/KNR4 family protein [Actinomycetota bacterium]